MKFRHLLLMVLMGTGGSAFANPSLELSNPLIPGGSALLSVQGVPSGSRFLGGTLDQEPFPVTPDGRAMIALDMEAEAGASQLKVRMATPQGGETVISRTLEIPRRAFHEERITLPEKKVELSPKDLARSKKETAAIVASYKARGGFPGYLDGFRLPVQGRVSGVFGSRRILNGKPRSPHNGADLAAPLGTPVATTAPGTVVLVGREYFFTGNTVVVHHGDGIFSLYCHLDSVAVNQGERLAAGGTVGTLGKTGRATGPHLHWGARVREARVDPLSLPGVERPSQGAEH